MITPKVLKEGLLALFGSSDRKVDNGLEKLWAQLTRELNDEQWRFGVDLVLRTRTYSTPPPPGLVIEACHMMPLPPKVPPIRERDFWDNAAQRAFVESVVYNNPRMGHEGPLGYARRIACLSGLMSPDDNEIALDTSHIMHGIPGSAPDGARLPYRDAE